MPKKRTSLIKIFVRVALFAYVIPIGILVILHYPYDIDPVSVSFSDGEKQEVFYETAYEPLDAAAQEYASRYAKMASEAADKLGVEPMLRNFVETYELKAQKRILEIGSGTGRWQDLVDDYTGLDISPTVAEHYHKPFVQASATDIPFPDDTFDAIWSIWVLEHIPNPERALAEMRRVLKNDGLLCLVVAWNCHSWLADGYPVRPYSDFGAWGKIVKASLVLRSHPLFMAAYRLPTRYTRLADYRLNGVDARLRFRALEANYNTYWVEDSDAAISIDSFEAYLWFLARGDELINCKPPAAEIYEYRNPLVVRVRKEGPESVTSD